jgi:D-alanyl-D-alanine carboxypeptidase
MRAMLGVVTLMIVQAAVPAVAAGQRMVLMEVVESDDPRAQLVAGLAHLMLTADSAAAADYVLRNAAPSAPRDSLLRQTATMREFVRAVDGAAIGEFLVRESDGQAVSVRLGTGPGVGLSLILETTPAPYLITRVARGTAPPPPPVAERFSTFAELDAALTSRAQANRFSGVVLAANGSEVLFHRPYGYADVERKQAVTTETRFNLGSGNKQFTAVAILRLVQEGRIGLDDPVGRYVQGLSARTSEQVTIRHLLQHRAGLGDYLRHPDYNLHREREWTTDELVALFRDDDPAFAPGARRVYSNNGYVLIGAVIESVTGRPYADVVRDWVYRPAGMDRSGPEGPGAAPNTAIGLAGSDDVVSNEGFRPRPSAAGGHYSTAADLLRFLQALSATRLLDRQHTELMLNGFEAGRPATGARPFEMGGGLGGISVSLRADLDTGHTAIILANRSHPVAEVYTTAMMNSLFAR